MRQTLRSQRGEATDQHKEHAKERPRVQLRAGKAGHGNEEKASAPCAQHTRPSETKKRECGREIREEVGAIEEAER